MTKALDIVDTVGVLLPEGQGSPEPPEPSTWAACTAPGRPLVSRQWHCPEKALGVHQQLCPVLRREQKSCLVVESSRTCGVGQSRAVVLTGLAHVSATLSGRAVTAV